MVEEANLAYHSTEPMKIRRKIDSLERSDSHMRFIHLGHQPPAECIKEILDALQNEYEHQDRSGRITN